MSYSYKPVLILALLENNGSISLLDAAKYFHAFYAKRLDNGLAAEKSNSIYSDLNCSLEQIRQNIRANPVKALTSSSALFQYNAPSDTLRIDEEYWQTLSPSEVDKIADACYLRLQRYYANFPKTQRKNVTTGMENREEYKDVPISKLELQVRPYNALRRAGIDNVYQLIDRYEELSTLRDMGEGNLRNVNERLSVFVRENAGADGEDDNLDVSGDIKNRSIEDLVVSPLILHALQSGGVETIGQALDLEEPEIMLLRNMGSRSCQQLMEQLSYLREYGDDYFSMARSGKLQPETASAYDKRRLDIVVANILLDRYGLSRRLLMEWYDVSRSRIDQLLKKKINRGHWLDKKLRPEEQASISAMVEARMTYREDADKKFYLLTNKKNDCAILIVSDEDIKCFFLTDLPEELERAVENARMHQLTEAELGKLEEYGKVVSILKKDHFMPGESTAFSKLADARQMSNEEYAMFLFGLPYASASTTITDERIIATLEEYTVDGVTRVPQSPLTHWFFNYASRSGYTTKELIGLYGFRTEPEETEAGTTFEEAQADTLEEDMAEYAGTGDYVETLFAKNPLLGSAILSEKSISALSKNSKKCVDQVLEDPRLEAKLSLKAKMQITLTVIHYAKSWDASDESAFWRYIVKQFGYRDENEKVRMLLCNCVRDALLRNHRLFLSNSGGNLYKSTIVMHAFSTRRSWMLFCDLLFDFYKNNLNWDYIEGDPLFARMVISMRNKLQNTADADDNGIKISSKVYNFREGIHKLILFRPSYATKLIAKMVKRIDALINHTAAAATCYEDVLCDEWLEEKMRRGSLAASTNQHHEHHAVAIDYTRIRPVYQLENDNEVRIAFPDVRLKDSEFAEITMLIYCKGVLVEQKVCKQYGSELGRTMERFSISLADYLRKSGSDEIDPQVVLRYGAKEIYNSEKTLCREYLIFRNKAETAADSLTQGGYTVVLPGRLQAEFINADVSSVIEESYIKAYFVKLHKDFAVRIGNQIVAVDTAAVSSSGARVVFPAAATAARYIEGGTHYRIVSGKEPIHIIMPAEDGAEKRYLLTVNGSAVAFNTLTSDEMEGVKAYTLRLDSFAEDALSVKLLDFANDKLVAAAQFKVIPEIFYKFDKLFYALPEDYDGASVLVTVGNSLRTTCQVTFGDTDISIPYQDGSLEIPVPAVRVYDNANNVWDGSICCWIRDLPQERFLYVKTPAGVSAAILLDGQPVGTAAGDGFALGNAVFGYSNDLRKDWLNVQAKVSSGSEERVIRLGRIAAKEQFLTKPALFTDGHDLRWDLGHSFIGNTQAKLEICICQDTPYERTLRLDLGNDLLAADIDIPIGEYRFSIQKASENLFSTAKEELETGTFCVGDENELRFLHKVIQIDAITPWGSEKVASVAIDRCYIEDVVYHGIENIPAEDGECPVYTGTLVYPLEDGKKYIYSSEERENKRGQLLYKVNPVKIIYLNQNALSITNEDDDGLYYVKYLRKIDQFAKRAAYQITDREPTKETEKHYFNADLYLYTRKGKDDV